MPIKDLLAVCLVKISIYQAMAWDISQVVLKTMAWDMTRDMSRENLIHVVSHGCDISLFSGYDLEF